MTVQELIDKLSESVDKNQVVPNGEDIIESVSTATEAEMTTYGLLKRN